MCEFCDDTTNVNYNVLVGINNSGIKKYVQVCRYCLIKINNHSGDPCRKMISKWENFENEQRTSPFPELILHKKNNKYD